ncbi:DUF2325 domain-containing protein [Tissierella carlieri]|jgi:hypothetical protein|uniref:DUF2325 domain-containing protein n=1 Tax=Tissierella carlieri TaxID=689904 RepID=A0ABT1SAH1_9FIRM|nr:MULTISPECIES: DUF2325 domain-containing protein [Tissierella]MBU5312920.1 DUF2325 domain-containing protein [Tissierella carlieri]MCQ4923470.1 DUF2325 domain-containing protein [Tissierella carlieri]MDU5083047.1 DUF2325 domain-containing protein [Bacillota bacterium]OZV11174.1 ABC transporter substrate-binding protein [Tissierella sp. P1]
MCIVLVGGHDRMHDDYREIGDKHGYKMKIFTQMPSRFNKNIGEPQAIVLFTNTVSHKMALTATKEAKRKKIPILRCHTSSKNSLEETLLQLKVKVC